MKNNKQKFMHYAFEVLLLAMGTGTAGLIVFSIIVAFQNL